MNKVNYNYDEVSDTLYVSFEPGEKATGVQLNDHMLLRVNKNERRAVGLTFFEYSFLAQNTEFGPRSFPLSGLTELSDDFREMVLNILKRPPINELLRLSAYTPSAIETTPISHLRPPPYVAA